MFHKLLPCAALSRSDSRLQLTITVHVADTSDKSNLGSSRGLIFELS